MNTKKALCKYLDYGNKGYIDGGDITGTVILVGFSGYIIISLFATIGMLILNGGHASVIPLTELYTITHTGVGCLASFVGGIVLYTAYLSLKTLFQHKFLICKRV